MTEDIFCKIAKKEIPSRIVYEDNEVIAFEDVKPKAPVHILVIPKKHIVSVNLKPKDQKLLGKMLLVLQKIAKKRKIDKTGYRLIINVGKDAGQTIEHLHIHLIGGKRLPWA